MAGWWYYLVNWEDGNKSYCDLINHEFLFGYIKFEVWIRSKLAHELSVSDRISTEDRNKNLEMFIGTR